MNVTHRRSPFAKIKTHRIDAAGIPAEAFDDWRAAADRGERFVVEVASDSRPGTWHRVEINATATPVRCSCEAARWRSGACKHQAGLAHALTPLRRELAAAHKAAAAEADARTAKQRRMYAAAALRLMNAGATKHEVAGLWQNMMRAAGDNREAALVWFVAHSKDA
jgi:hypothetical protein